MKIIKKLLCVILSIATLLCCCVSASAAELKATTVGVLTIFSSSGGGSSSFSTSGHAFLSFKNTSAQQIKIGGLNVNQGHEITFGTWGTKPAGYTIEPDIKWHKGIWYDLEAYLINYDNDLSDRVSLSIDITMDDVQKINLFISICDCWSLNENCSSFASRLWNCIAPDNLDLSAGLPNTPTSLSKNIKNKSGYQIKRAVMNITPIGYVNEDGNFVSVTLRRDSYRCRCIEYDYTPDTLEVA